VVHWGHKNIAGALVALEAKGHSLFEPIQEVGDSIMVASFLDGDGNIIGLIKNPPFPNEKRLSVW